MSMNYIFKDHSHEYKMTFKKAQSQNENHADMKVRTALLSKTALAVELSDKESFCDGP